MTISHERFEVLPDANGTIPLSATDIAQYQRTDRCARALRLRMFAQTAGEQTLAARMRRLGISLEHPSPYPLAAGRAYEARINAHLSTNYQTHTATDESPLDGAHIPTLLATLTPGETVLLIQPTLQARVHDWLLTGRPDLIQLHCTPTGAHIVRIADIKSARAANYDHHLQVGVYERICRTLFPPALSRTIQTAILYQPPLIPALTPFDEQQQAIDSQRARDWFTLDSAWCAVPSNPDQLRNDIDRIFAQLPHADGYAARTTPFDELPYAFGTGCASCPYMQLCLLRAHEQTDIALIPGIDRTERSAFRQHGIHTVPQLAALADVSPERQLIPRAAARTPALIADQTIGPALEDWIARAQRQRNSGVTTPAYLPTASIATLPRIKSSTNPDLCMLTIEPHRDGGTGLLWAIAARIQPHHGGIPATPHSHVDLLPAPPTLNDEGALVERFCTALDAHAGGQPTHVLVYAADDWRILCAAINRHLDRSPTIRTWADILMQVRAVTAPSHTALATELQHTNSFSQPVNTLVTAARQYGFDWVTPHDDFPRLFHAQLFDQTIPRTGHGASLVLRARVHGAVPSEYCAAAWDVLPAPDVAHDAYAPYRAVTAAVLRRFLMHRIAALVHLATKAGRWHNRATIPVPPAASGAAPSFVTALAESLTLERAATLRAWYEAHRPHPAARVRQGTTLIAHYDDALQQPAMAERIDAYRRSGTKTLTQCTFTLRLATATDLPPLPTQRALTSLLSIGTAVIIAPFPTQALIPLHPHALSRNAMRATVHAVDTLPDGSITLTLQPSYSPHRPPHSERGESFIPVDGAPYTIDASPDNPPGLYTANAVERLAADPAANTLAQLLHTPPALRDAPLAAGLRAYVAACEASAVATFGTAAHAYICAHAATPLLLVQGPPGTGKTFTTAHAILARLTAAISAGTPLRIAVTAQTHAAVDALMGTLSAVIGSLHAQHHPDAALLAQIRLFRYRPNAHTPPLAQVIGMDAKAATVRAIATTPWCVVAATPTPVSALLTPQQPWCDVLFLDESSQLALPLALAAATVLTPTGSVVVIGDPRQMPAIVSHDWAHEPHRQFRQYPVAQSLYDYIEANPPGGVPVPVVRLDESRRVPQEVAAFLQSVIYHRDGITYHSTIRDRLQAIMTFDPLLRAILDPAAAMVLITHDEDRSHTRNPFEVALVTHVLQLLIAHGLDGHIGYGVVVPHRMQRAAIADAIRPLLPPAPATLLNTVTSVPGIDTVERFQGSQRTVMLVSATESHPATLARNEAFLYDIRRLNVALSRAQRKVIVIAAQTVFAHSPQTPEIQQQPPIWQHYAQWCNHPVYDGVFDGVGVHVSVYRPAE